MFHSNSLEVQLLLSERIFIDGCEIEFSSFEKRDRNLKKQRSKIEEKRKLRISEVPNFVQLHDFERLLAPYGKIKRLYKASNASEGIFDKERIKKYATFYVIFKSEKAALRVLSE